MVDSGDRQLAPLPTALLTRKRPVLVDTEMSVDLTEVLHRALKPNVVRVDSTD